MRAADHAGLPRHLRDRPHQPAGVLQSVLPQARAADRPRRCASRSRSGSTPQGTVLIPLDEDAGRAPRSTRRWRRASRRSRSCSCIPTAIRRTSSAPRRSSSRSFPSCSSPPRTSCRRSTASTSAPRRPPPTPMSGRACAVSRPRWSSHLDEAGFDGNFLIVQSNGGLFDVDEARRVLHPHAGIGPGRRRDRHQGAVRQHRHEERHRLRHGRHHRQGRRDLRRRRADDRRRADRRLCHGPADPDPDDRHPGGRHRRRQHRARRSSAARCASARRAPARRRARSATGSAAPSRPSPTPTWCSAGSAPTASSAAR